MTALNWKECVSQGERWFAASRFEWPDKAQGGFNCSEQFTISEVWGAISWIWTWPGDWILRSEPINSFFELSPNLTGHWVSTTLGWVILFWAMSASRS
jgi:hypothetical protein